MGFKVHICASQAPRKQHSLIGAMNRGTWEVPQPQKAAQARCCLSSFPRQPENPTSSTAKTSAECILALFVFLGQDLPHLPDDYLKAAMLTDPVVQQWHSFCREDCHCQAPQLSDTKCVFKGQHQKEGFEQRSLLSPVTSVATDAARH